MHFYFLEHRFDREKKNPPHRIYYTLSAIKSIPSGGAYVYMIRVCL